MSEAKTSLSLLGIMLFFLKYIFTIFYVVLFLISLIVILVKPPGLLFSVTLQVPLLWFSACRGRCNLSNHVIFSPVIVENLQLKHRKRVEARLLHWRRTTTFWTELILLYSFNWLQIISLSHTSLQSLGVSDRWGTCPADSADKYLCRL